MLRRKKKPADPQKGSPAPPSFVPDMEFMEQVLQTLSGGMRELSRLAKKPQEAQLLQHKCLQARGTVSYAQALLKLQKIRQAPGEPQALVAVINEALNNLRGEFLYAGVAVRRPPEEALQSVEVPHRLVRFLLEEMVTCGLRCAPSGKQLHMGATRIGQTLLLGLRTEGGQPLLQAPLFSLPGEEEKLAQPEDYGFAFCRTLATLAGWQFRWEVDAAGLRMFLDIRL